MTEEKKVALVTGGSRGIGKACALELAKSGYDVVINYAGNDAAANETVGELKALGVEAEALKFNVADKDAAKEAVAKIFEKFGRIDVLVNNAGITRDGLAIRMSYENWEDVINTNLNSMFYVTKPVVEKMLKQKKRSCYKYGKCLRSLWQCRSVELFFCKSRRNRVYKSSCKGSSFKRHYSERCSAGIY